MNQEILKAANQLDKEIAHARDIVSQLNAQIKVGNTYSFNFWKDECLAILPVMQQYLEKLRAEFASLGEPRP